MLNGWRALLLHWSILLQGIAMVLELGLSCLKGFHHALDTLFKSVFVVHIHDVYHSFAVGSGVVVGLLEGFFGIVFDPFLDVDEFAHHVADSIVAP